MARASPPASSSFRAPAKRSSDASSRRPFAIALALGIALAYLSFNLAPFSSLSLSGLFPFTSVPVPSPPSSFSPSSSDNLPSLLHADLESLSSGLSQGRFSSVDLVRAYTRRIAEVNHVLHAVNEINPEAESIAHSLDLERSAGHVRSPLHGIPVLLKDNMATADSMETSAGSHALLGARPAGDAAIVRKLRAAGAVVLGKANLSQWANFRSSNSSDGWSAVGGQCEGAYYPGQTPLGSSSGSGVAPSVGLAWAALGTETSGSIVGPADFNNVVGIKPTVGLTSRTLVIPVSSRQDTVGPLAASVKDAAYLLQAIAGVDHEDNYTLATPYHERNIPLPDYVAACRPGGLKGKRIGIPRNLAFPAHDTAPILALFERAVAAMRALGATVVDNTNVTAYSAEQTQSGASIFQALQADFLADLEARYLSRLVTNPANITSVADLRRFTRQTPAEDYPARDTARWDEALALPFAPGSAAHWELVRANEEVAGRQGILGVMANHSLDALVLPTAFTYVQAGVLGTLIISVPMGFLPDDTPVYRQPPRNESVVRAPGVPVGLAFLGRKWSEEMLVAMAYAFEQRTMVRDQGRPYLLPKTEIGDVREGV